MSATSGMWIFALIVRSAAAASGVGTAQRMISHPAFSSSRICRTVASASSVFVFVIDWIRTGLPPPMTRSPMRTVLVCSLVIFFISFFCKQQMCRSGQRRYLLHFRIPFSIPDPDPDSGNKHRHRRRSRFS